MKEILLPTDFSSNALNAIFTAIKLQKNTSCNFTILHVYDADKRNISHLQDDNRTGMIYSALHKDTMSKLKQTLTTISEVTKSKVHSFEIKAASGDLASIINELVPKNDIDMIVMGTKGATGAKQIFLGSNTVRVLKKIRNNPILAIPESFNFQSLQKIVFPTEFAHFFSKNQLNQLLELAKAWSSELLVFQVAQEFSLSDEQKANKILLQKRFESLKYSFHKMVIHTTVAEAINEFANEQLADLICLIHYNHTFMEKLTQEPVVSKVGFQTEIPLLVLPE